MTIDSVRTGSMEKGSIGAVSFTEISGTWRRRDYGTIENNGKKYPAFKLKGIEFYKVEGQSEPTIKIYEDKETGIEVFVTPYDDKGKTSTFSFSTIETAKQLTPSDKAKIDDTFDAVVIPKVAMNESHVLEPLFATVVKPDSWKDPQKPAK